MEEIIGAFSRITSLYGNKLRSDSGFIEQQDETPVLTVGGPKSVAFQTAKDLVVILNAIPQLIEAIESKSGTLEAFVSVADVKKLIGEETAKISSLVGGEQVFKNRGEAIKLVRDEIDIRLGEHLEKGHEKF